MASTATERIKAADQGARILIVTDYDDEELRRAAMRAGACVYVLKYNLLALVLLREAKGQRWQVNAMQKLIEFYEMVSLNEATLRGSEKTAILKARLALKMFERTMKSFKAISSEVPSASEHGLRMAA